ncbi:MAG: hypothetical protein ACR2QL_04835 [Woeseiaceae bacterium]
MNKFFDQHITVQWVLALLMLLMLFSIFILWIKLLPDHLVALPLIILVPTLVQFFAAPMAKLVGIHTYLSPMLFVNNASNKKYEIHSGTPFDYLLVMKKTRMGTRFRKQMLSYFLDGLLGIVERIEATELPESVIVQGNSYFFNVRTASKLGFDLSEPSIAVRINLLVNYFDLTWMYSLSQARISFPKISEVKTAEITGSRLVMNKHKLIRLNSFLNKNDPDKSGYAKDVHDEYLKSE